MTQKLSKNPHIPAEEQISKITVDLENDRLKITYHLGEGEIVARKKVMPRIGLMGITSKNEQNNKEVENPFV